MQFQPPCPERNLSMPPCPLLPHGSLIFLQPFKHQPCHLFKDLHTVFLPQPLTPQGSRMSVFISQNLEQWEYATADLVNIWLYKTTHPSNTSFIPCLHSIFAAICPLASYVIPALLQMWHPHLQQHCIFSTNCSQLGDVTPSGSFTLQMYQVIVAGLRLNSGRGAGTCHSFATISMSGPAHHTSCTVPPVATHTYVFYM